MTPEEAAKMKAEYKRYRLALLSEVWDRLTAENSDDVDMTEALEIVGQMMEET